MSEDRKKRYIVAPDLATYVPERQRVFEHTGAGEANEFVEAGKRDGFSGGRATPTQDSRYVEQYSGQLHVTPSEGTPIETDQGVLPSAVVVSQPGQPGRALHIWQQSQDDQDNADAAWQVRQSPLVMHQRTDVLTKDTWACQPQYVKLANGDLRLYWMSSHISPWQLTRTADPSAGTPQGAIYYKTCRGPSQLWSNTAEAPAAGGIANGTRAFAAVAIPGTDDVMLIRARLDGVTIHINNHIVASVGYGPNGMPGTNRGAINSTPYLDGIDRDTYVNIQTFRRSEFGATPYSELSRVYSMRAAFLPSGRLVLVVAEPGGLWSMTSDNYGATWTRHLISFLYDAMDYWGPQEGDPHNLYREPEYVDVSLVLAENGNLMLGTVEPSQMGMFCPHSNSGSEEWIRSYTTPSVRDTASMNVRLLCSSDGVSWGGGKIPIYDYSKWIPFNGFVYATAPVDVYRPGRGYLYRRYAVTITNDPLNRDDEWSFDGSKLGYTFDPTTVWGWPLDVTENPGKSEWYNAQHTYPYWQSLPMHISLSLSPDGWVDVHLTTAPAWNSDEQQPGPEHPTLTLETGGSDPPPDEDQHDTLQYARFYVTRPISGRCELLHRRFSTRTPRPNEGPDIWLPVVGGNQTKMFHPVHPVTSQSDVSANQIAGYTGGLATVAWRGSTLLASTQFSYTGSTLSLSPKLGFCVWRLGGWQPLVERLGWWSRRINDDNPLDDVSQFYTEKDDIVSTTGSHGGGSMGRTYNRCWSAGVPPGSMGWDGGESGLASVEVVPASNTPGNVHSGHLFMSVPPNTLSNYSTQVLPRPTGVLFWSVLNGSMRVLVAPQSGSSPYGDQQAAFFRLTLVDTDLVWCGSVRVRIHSDSDNNRLSMSVSTGLTGFVEGPEIVLDPDSSGKVKWSEFLLSIEATSDDVGQELAKVRVYWRYLAESQALDAEGQSVSPGSYENSDLSDYLNQFRLVYDEDEYQLVEWSAVGSVPETASFGALGAETDGPTTTWRWKHVFVHRPEHAPSVSEPLSGNPAVDPQRMYTVAFDTDARNAFLSNRGRAWASDIHEEAGNAQFDSLFGTQSGIVNFPMGAALSPRVPVWLNQYYSIYATGPMNLGESWDINPLFLYDETNVWSQPARQEWRWTPQYAKYGGDDLRADWSFAVLEGIRPEAWVVVGRNTPTIDLHLIVSETDDFNQNSCVRAFVLGITESTAGQALMNGESRHAVNTGLWTNFFDQGANPGATVLPNIQFRFSKNQVFAFSPGEGNAKALWTPHRYASQEAGGAQFYVAFQLRSTEYVEPRVYRILDNTGSTLTLESNIEESIPGGWEATSVLTGAIYSDRFAIDLRDLTLPIEEPGEGQLPPDMFDANLQGAPFKRVHARFGPAYFMDSSAAFHRCGRMVLGSVYDLSRPDVDWDWSYTTNSGTALVRTPNNTVHATTNSAPYRTITTMLPLQAAAPYHHNKLGAVDKPLAESWQRTMAFLNRLAVDGREAVLLWQGELFATTSTQNPSPLELGAIAMNTHSPVTTDPMHILLVRASGPVQVQAQLNSCQPVWQNGTLVYLPLPEAKVGQLTFVEEF